MQESGCCEPEAAAGIDTGHPAGPAGPVGGRFMAPRIGPGVQEALLCQAGSFPPPGVGQPQSLPPTEAHLQVHLRPT